MTNISKTCRVAGRYKASASSPLRGRCQRFWWGKGSWLQTCKKIHSEMTNAYLSPFGILSRTPFKNWNSDDWHQVNGWQETNIGWLSFYFDKRKDDVKAYAIVEVSNMRPWGHFVPCMYDVRDTHGSLSCHTSRKWSNSPNFQNDAQEIRSSISNGAKTSCGTARSSQYGRNTTDELFLAERP